MAMKGHFLRAISLTHLAWLALGAGALFAVVTNRQDLGRIARMLPDSDPAYLTAATAILLLYLVNLSEFYRSTFSAADLRGNAVRFLLVSCASHFVNLVTKTGGFGGLSVYLPEARRQGDPGARAGAAYLTAIVLGYTAYLGVLAVALVLLYSSSRLTSAEIVAAAVLLTLILGAGSALMAGFTSRDRLCRLCVIGATPLNLFARLLGRQPVLTAEAAAGFSAELHDAVHTVAAKPQRYIRPLGHALGVEVLSALMLFAVARALHVTIGFEVALAGYSISLLFAIVSITPAGLGFVELSLTLFLVSFGVPRTDALAVTLMYRCFDFWLPVALGSLSLFALRALNGSTVSA